LLADDYANYAENSNSAEFNFRWRVQVIDYIISMAVREGIYVASGYWTDLVPTEYDVSWTDNLSDDRYITVSRVGMMKLLPDIPPDLENAKVMFIIGTDWGVGKTSFLFNRMKEGAAGISTDIWFGFVSKYSLPITLTQDYFSLKGVIANEIYRAWSENPNREIYIRLNGRIEEYVYGIPLDRRPIIDGLLSFFHNSKICVILKPSQTWVDIRESVEKLAGNAQKPDEVEAYTIHYDGSEERIDTA
jgi:hypothetical protein